MMYQPPSQEVVLFQDAEVLVTSGRFQVGAVMYPVRGITAVSAGYWSQPGSKAIAWMLVILAFLAVASSGANARGGMILGGLFLVGALVSALRSTATAWHTVVVHTGGMQQTAVTTKDQQRRDAIVAALHRATSGV